jgi:hypothetical protein
MRLTWRSASSGLALAVHALMLGASVSLAQDLRPGALHVFVDCSECDDDHFRREIRFVNYMRDRADADVHVLITEQDTGADGSLFTLQFIGRGEFSGLDDELEYVSSPVDTNAEERDGLTHILELGLVRYAARTPEAVRLLVLYSPPDAAAPPDSGDAQLGVALLPPEVSDPWNFWVFRFGMGGSLGGEARQRFGSANGRFTASRVTDAWKLSLRLRGSYNESQFDIDSTNTVTSTIEEYTAEGLLVRSAGDHWGIGFLPTAEHSSFSNYDLALRLAPAVEYNIFPYTQSTRRQLRILFSTGVNRFDYIEETIFGKTAETLFDARINLSLDVTEVWGSALAGVEASQFLGEPGKNRLSFFGSLDIQLFKGFGLSIWGDLSRVRDQLNLPAGEATPEEILLQQRELATDFRFSTSLSITYTFGSIYSNVVNPRFGG